MELYDFVEQLGRGTFATVYKCQKKQNKQAVVVKQIPINLEGEDLQKAKNEVALLRAVNNPNIIEYYDSFIKHAMFYIVMEYASHGSLYQYITNRKQGNIYLGSQTVMDFFCQIVMGLNHIHEKGIVHRDLKCENIFVTGKSSNVLKIGDFGISKLTSDKNRFANTIIGTCNYVAPEICSGKPYDFKSDIWALGCILYEMCQMEKMFEGTVANIVASITQGKVKPINSKMYGKQIQEILNILLNVDPNRRPDTKTIMALNDVYPTMLSLSVNLGCIF